MAYYIGLFHIKTKTVGLQILYKRQYRKIYYTPSFNIEPCNYKNVLLYAFVVKVGNALNEYCNGKRDIRPNDI